MSRSRAAMSLVELVIVILIISILSSVAAPKFLDSFRRSRVDAAARRIQYDLNRARQVALAQSTTSQVTFSSLTDSYSVSQADRLDSRDGAYQVDLTESPYEVTLDSASVGKVGVVIFDMYGHPNQGGTITLTANGYSQTVTLNAATGRATVP